jgi:hypothetical protein
MEDGLRMVQTRTCGVWVLPGDPTCAGVARRLFRGVASELALDPEAIDDGITMVSELAANTLHASQRQPLPVNPELWLYLRCARSSTPFPAGYAATRRAVPSAARRPTR